MCDTMGFLGNGAAYFGKNSDRSPNEPQVLEYRPAHAPKSDIVQTTYLAVPETTGEIRGTLLSRPCWMWGAEIGVNDAGVCIGNEAVFTRGKYGRTGLTGMDMLRLALERSTSAPEAVDTLIRLLETYGQGGDCGFDHSFFYDNSFLVMDRGALYVLETAGKKYVVRQKVRDSISNRLTVRKEGDRYADGKAYDFAAQHTEPLFSYFSQATRRRASTQGTIERASGAGDLMRALRMHAPGADPFCRGSVDSVCMHYGGLVGDHTTASMVVELLPERMLVWATHGSLPCVSLYLPMRFGAEPCLPACNGEAGFVFGGEDCSASELYWFQHEQFCRSLCGKVLPTAYFEERDAMEASWIDASRDANDGAIDALSLRAAEEAGAFYRKWNDEELPDGKTKKSFRMRWAKKDASLGWEKGQ